MIRKSVSSEGAICFWSAGRIERVYAEAAFSAEGLSHFLPQADEYGALRRACMEIVTANSLGGGYRVRPYTLSGNPSGAGTELRSIVPGLTRNDMPFLFSAGVCLQKDGSHAVEVLDVDNSPAMAGFRKDVVSIEKQIDRRWREECQWISANDMTHAIVEMIRHNQGVMIRNEGVVWYLTSDKMEQYERIADALSPHGVSMQAVYFQPDVNTKLLEHVRDEIVRRQQAVFDGHIEDLQMLEDKGAKARMNGQRTRVEEWVAAHKALSHHRDLLGKAFEQIEKAAEDARQRIGEEAFAAFL